MGREVRRVPLNWVHPQTPTRQFVPLSEISFLEAATAWDQGKAHWDAGNFHLLEMRPQTDEERALSWEEWLGAPRPTAETFMPYWPEEERTHFRMYETVTSGTPLSPPMPNLEALARWLTDNRVPIFIGVKPTYRQWLEVCFRGLSPSMSFDPIQGLTSDMLAPEPAEAEE